MKMTGMFIVSSRSGRLLLLSGPTPIFCPIEGVLAGHPFFPRSAYRLELCVKWLPNRQFNFHYSVFLACMTCVKKEKRGGEKRELKGIPTSPFPRPKFPSFIDACRVFLSEIFSLQKSR